MTPPVPAPCRIVLMELAGGPQPLAIDTNRYRAAGVFFLLHEVPLGYHYLSAPELPLSAEQMWEIATEAILPALTDYLIRMKPAGQLLEQFAATNPIDAFEAIRRHLPAAIPASAVSVVICTHERPAALVRCLASLEKLSEQPLEILVIDNAPKTDAIRNAVSEFPNVRYKMEPRPGLSYARNTGVVASRGEFIAFTDDDVEVTENWLRELIRPFTDAAVMCTTGLVLPAEMETQEQSYFESWLPFHRGYTPFRLGPQWLAKWRKAPPVWDLGAGASMALRRTAFDKIGLFDTRLGAGASGCSEDSELWYRLIAAGHSCDYAPASLVLHYHRADAASLANQMRLYARGHATALMVQFARHGHLGNLVRVFIVLPIYYLRKLATSVIFREWMPFWRASARGYLAGLFYLARNRKDRSSEPGRVTVIERRRPVPVLRGSGPNGAKPNGAEASQNGF